MPARRRSQSEQELYATCREAMKTHIGMLNAEFKRGKALFKRGLAQRDARTRERWAIVEKHIVQTFFGGDYDSAAFREFLAGIRRDTLAHEKNRLAQVDDEAWEPFRFRVPRSI